MGAASNSFSSTENGFQYKQEMHHFHAKYGMARMFNGDKKSMDVYQDYLKASKVFYTAAFS